MSTAKHGTAAAASIGGMLLAFLSTQHHNLHMLLLTLGVGGSTMTFVQSFPAVRRIMLLVSVGVVALNLRALRHRSAPAWMRAATIAFSAITLGIVGWSVVRAGL